MKVEINPAWNFKNDLSTNLKNQVLAKSISFSGHKTVIANLLSTLAPITQVNGIDVYARQIDLKNRTSDYESKESELLKTLLGMDNTGLDQISGSGADNIELKWTLRGTWTKPEFSFGVGLIKDAITDVDTIELNSTMISYWVNKEKPNPDYVTPDASGLLSGRSIYDGELTGFTYLATDTNLLYTKLSDTSGDWDAGVTPEPEFIPLTYDDRVPLDFDYYSINGLFVDDIYKDFQEKSFEERSIANLEDNILRDNNTLMSSQYLPSVVFKDSLGSDITSNYDAKLIQAVVSMLAISGEDFMSKVGVLNKTGEVLADSDTSYIVSGTQIYDATIKQSFIDDVSGLYYEQYVNNDNEFPKDPEEMYRYIDAYGQHFWYYRDNNNFSETIYDDTNGLFIINPSNNKIYLTVDGFRNCTYEEYGKWIFLLAEIDAYNDSGCCGIGGFIGDFLGLILSAVGIIVNTIIDIFEKIVILIVRFIGALIGLDTDWILSTQMGKTFTRTTATAIYIAVMYYIGIFGAEELITVETIFSTAVMLSSQSMNIRSIQDEVSMARRQQLLMERMENETKENEKDKIGSSLDSEGNDYENSLKYDPFFRMEVIEKIKYESLISFERKDPFLNNRTIK